MQSALFVLLGSLVATAVAGYARVAGYTPISDIASALSVGPAIEAVDAALSAEPRDWAAALDAYEQVRVNGTSLRNILPSESSGRGLLNVFSTHYGSADYMHEFVHAALTGAGKFAVDEKPREELAMKGIVLQGVLMASMTALQDSLTSCLAGRTGDSNGAPHDVDKAWGFYACSVEKGPIKLAEKRAPQFDVEANLPTEAGASQVNARLLSLFQELQGSAQRGNCSHMQQLVRAAIAQMQVPVIQGLLREAYEVDPQEVEEHHGADGFVEVAEGWAFASAVLPAIAACSPEAAAIITRNLDTIGLGAAGPHVPDGYGVVKSAVESTYQCLRISCDEVNAMVDPWRTGQTLWEPCDDAALPVIQREVTPAGESESSSGQSKIPCLGVVAMALVAVVGASARQAA